MQALKVVHINFAFLYKIKFLFVIVFTDAGAAGGVHQLEDEMIMIDPNKALLPDSPRDCGFRIMSNDDLLHVFYSAVDEVSIGGSDLHRDSGTFDHPASLTRHSIRRG